MKKFILLCCLIFTVGLGGAYKILVLDYRRTSSYPTSIVFQIPPKVSAKSIAYLLEKEGIINSQRAFYWAVRLRGVAGKLRSGEYEFPATRSPESVARKLLTGDVLYHRLTIAEGLTSDDIAALIQSDERLSGAMPLAILEGTLLPETYTFQRGRVRDELVKDMTRALQEALDELWQARPHDTLLKTQHEVLIMASLVEKETRLAHERPHIAAVFLNRLRKGMALQTDPTVIYALELMSGNPLGRDLLRKDLTVDSPYNTYLHKGLPPAPICHPGLASIQAVLAPLHSDDLFFVADGTGGHVFSKTYRNHARNHAKWRKIKGTSKK